MGPGTELKRLLAKFFINSEEGCKCDQRAAVMDTEGPDWCEKNMEIILGWLADAAKERGLPFIKYAGRVLVRRAISNARAKERIMQGWNGPTE